MPRGVIPPVECVNLLHQWRKVVHFNPLLWFGDKGTDRANIATFTEQAVCSGPVTFFPKHATGPHHNYKIQISFHCLPVWSDLAPLSSGLSLRHARILIWYFSNFWRQFYRKTFSNEQVATDVQLKLSKHFLESLEYQWKITTDIMDIREINDQLTKTKM